MWISVQGLEKKLSKLITEEYGRECQLNITELRIFYLNDEPQVTLKGNYGNLQDPNNLNVCDIWNTEFELDFSYRYFNDVSFIKGMLCQYIYERERID